jgi:hypothetical protein
VGKTSVIEIKPQSESKTSVREKKPQSKRKISVGEKNLSQRENPQSLFSPDA